MSLQAPKISVRNLYKIFGAAPETAMQQVKAGMGKAELLRQTGHVLGLNDINIDIRSGHITSIMGLSGSGKSTLIRHFNRLIEPTAGEILLDGENILSLSPERLRELRRSGMSMVFQKFALLPHRTVLENTCLPFRIEGRNDATVVAEAQKWLTRVGLTGIDNHYPHQLSGGMQQRVGIARALASNAAIMLMDEAFSALDPLIRTEMQDLLLELQRDLHKTIVFITHDLDEALKISDHIVILRDGLVVQQGDPQQILLQPADGYIEDFIRDINRGRVLHVRSVMQPLSAEPAPDLPSMDAETTLEKALIRAGSDMDQRFVVTSGGEAIGVLSIREVVRALVPAAVSR